MQKYVTTKKHPEYKAGVIVSKIGSKWGYSKSLGHEYISKDNLKFLIQNNYITEYKNSHFDSITIEAIMYIVCDYLQVNLEVLKKKNRKSELKQARHIIYYFNNQYSILSNEDVAFIFRQDRNSARHGIKVITRELEYDKRIIKAISDIKDILNKIYYKQKTLWK